jgi:predicted enzyme related to lactoylglutathione lyase
MLIMLMCFESPQPLPAHEHVANRIAISRIAFGVPDIDAAAMRVAAHGGTVLEHTRETMPEAEMLVVTDPDGLHLALVRRAG